MDKNIKFCFKEEIIDFVEEYGNHEKGYQEYDFIWIANVLRAAIDNMMKHALPIEIEEYGDFVDEKEKNFIIHLAECLKKYKDE